MLCIDLPDVARFETGFGEGEAHARDRSDTTRGRRRDVVGVGVAAAAEDLTEDRRAPFDGVVTDVPISPGDQLENGALLLTIDEATGAGGDGDDG